MMKRGKNGTRMRILTTAMTMMGDGEDEHGNMIMIMLVMTVMMTTMAMPMTVLTTMTTMDGNKDEHTQRKDHVDIVYDADDNGRWRGRS